MTMPKIDKKYYWLKLHRDFFRRHDIRIIESMPNGKDYILFYLKLLCESTSHEGNLRFSDTVPYSEEMLSTITNTNIDIVKQAITIFEQLNMLEILEDNTIYLNEVSKMLGQTEVDIEEQRRKNCERQKRHREKVKLLSNGDSNVTVTLHSNVEKELEIDKDINTKDISNERYKRNITLPPLYTLPTNKFNTKNEQFEITQEYFDELKETYPNVDIMQNLKQMKLWLNSNPTKRKTMNGMKSFINRWLSKEQNKGKPINSQRQYRDKVPDWMEEKSNDEISKMLNEFDEVVKK